MKRPLTEKDRNNRPIQLKIHRLKKQFAKAQNSVERVSLRCRIMRLEKDLI